MPLSSRALALLLLAPVVSAGDQRTSCTDPDLSCPAGWTSGDAQFSDRYGTPIGACGACIGTPPGGPGCVDADWTTLAPNPSAPQLAIPKFVSPGGLVQLIQVELIARREACSVVRVENEDPLNACVATLSWNTGTQLLPAPGQGLDFLGELLPGDQFGFANLQFSLAAYDGTTDFAGTSGSAWTTAGIYREVCVRITDPEELAAFVDDGSGPDMLFFDHSANRTASTSGCALHAFDAASFTGLELEVRYSSCVAPVTTFCFGSNADCPCGNGGAVDAGCDNAQATGGVRLTASGDPGLNTVVLHGTGFPASTSPTVVALRSEGAGVPHLLFGDGLLCLSSTGSAGRFGAVRASGGTSSHALDHIAGPGTFSYQLWYRNEPASFCNSAAAFNASSAISIDWP